ncbi:MAG TPA: hypothetical protein VNO81_03935 [Candidatus Nitrosotenuis sp.]|nr:hypothetical protein [Candidatus Nitrosotenuis sp.]
MIALVLACGLALAWVGQASAQTVVQPRHPGINACSTQGGGGTTVVTTGSQCPPQPCPPPPCGYPGGYSNPTGSSGTGGYIYPGYVYPYGGNGYGQGPRSSVRSNTSKGITFNLGGRKIRLVRGR